MPHDAPAEKLNVVILYHHLNYMRRAMATYLRSERAVADEFTPSFRVWRIDIALEPAFAEEAERDIAAADVIILAVNGRQPCPTAFQRWKGGQGQASWTPPRALIALVDASDDPAPAPESWSSVLRMAATQLHSDIFVCPEPDDTGASPLVLA